MIKYFNSHLNGRNPRNEEVIWQLMDEYQRDYEAGNIPPVQMIEFWEPLRACLESRKIMGNGGPTESGRKWRGMSNRFYLLSNANDFKVDSLGKIRFPVYTDIENNHMNHIHLGFNMYDCHKVTARSYSPDDEEHCQLK